MSLPNRASARSPTLRQVAPPSAEVTSPGTPALVPPENWSALSKTAYQRTAALPWAAVLGA